MTQQCASNNTVGVCPEAMEAFVRNNETGHHVSSCVGRWTEQVSGRNVKYTLHYLLLCDKVKYTML